MKMLHSIRFRLMMIIALILIGTLVVVSGVSYYYAHKYLSESLDETELSVASSAAAQVKSEMDISLTQLTDLASIARLQTGDKTQILPALKEAHQRIDKFDHTFFASLDGIAMNETGESLNISDREYFQTVIKAQKAYISEPYVSRTTQKQSIALCVPVMRSGQLIGVLYGTYSVDKLLPIVKNIKYKRQGYGFLLDDNGSYLAHPTRPELAGNMNMRTGEISAALQQKLGTGAKLDPALVAAFKEATDKNMRTRMEYKSTTGAAQAGSINLIPLSGGQRWILVMTTTREDATSEMTALTQITLGLSGLCLLLALAITFWVSGSFVRPILRINQIAQDTAAGNLQKLEKTIYDKSEMGQLSDNIMLMNENLRQLVQQVQAQAQQVAASSEELTASADESATASDHVAQSSIGVTEAVQHQMQAVRDTASTVAEISASIQDMSSVIHHIVATSDHTAALAQTGSKDVSLAVTEIQNIESATSRTGDLVGKLGERSKEIGVFVSTISGIAGQTNLLALNAAIEAARAGEQGRGFAVVAEEVRKLAEQSGEAAEQIANLIREIQDDTDDAVKGVAEAGVLVKHGADVVNTAGITFNTIVEKILDVSQQIRQSTQSIDQISLGSQKIVRAVEEIDAAARKSASQSETISAASEEQSAAMQEIASSSRALAALAQEMQNTVNKFRI